MSPRVPIATGVPIALLGLALSFVGAIQSSNRLLGLGLAVAIFGLTSVTIGVALSMWRLTLRVRKQGQEVHADFRQIEALLSIHSALRPEIPIPRTGEWAASADLLAYIVAYVLRHRPSTVLEFGSGVSTVILGLAMEKAGAGRVVSIESKERFASELRSLLETFGLSHRVDVRVAPIANMEFGDRQWEWYDTSDLRIPSPIDLVIVDGPPSVPGALTRYPALPAVRDMLAEDGLLILDDARRKDEEMIAARWKEQFPEYDFELVDHVKGTLIVRRRPMGSRRQAAESSPDHRLG